MNHAHARISILYVHPADVPSTCPVCEQPLVNCAVRTLRKGYGTDPFYDETLVHAGTCALALSAQGWEPSDA